jgi:hypothetical protein
VSDSVTIILSELLALKGSANDSTSSIPESDINDFAALVVLTAKVAGKDLTGELAIVLAEFAVKIGFQGQGEDKPPLQPLVDAYLVRHPPHPELMRRFTPRLASVLGRTLEDTLWRFSTVRV